MQKLLAEYFFQHKKCSLLQAGTLEIRNTEALIVSGDKKITPPVPEIKHTIHVTDATDLEDFIAVHKQISREEAAYQLKNFCSDIKSLQGGTKIEIPNAGIFSVNAAGKLVFTPLLLPPHFLPDVPAERIIHAGKAHAILVGDTETTNTAMAEFLTEDAPVKKSKWWLWAALLFLAAIALFFVYLNDQNRNSFFGISHQEEIKSAPATYRVP